jgi:hypothetical protein
MQRSEIPHFGVNVVGHVSGNLGLGVLARHVSLLLSRGCAVRILDIDPKMGCGGHDQRLAEHTFGSAVRESAAAAVQAAHRRSRPALAGAIPAWLGARRLRVGAARAARDGGAAVGLVGGAADGELASRVRHVAAPTPGRPRAGIPVGGSTSRPAWRRTKRRCSS